EPRSQYAQQFGGSADFDLDLTELLLPQPFEHLRRRPTGRTQVECRAELSEPGIELDPTIDLVPDVRKLLASVLDDGRYSFRNIQRGTPSRVEDRHVPARSKCGLHHRGQRARHAPTVRSEVDDETMRQQPDTRTTFRDSVHDRISRVLNTSFVFLG